MESNSDKNKRIAQNTILLYIRTAAIMVVSLYTSRIILNVLGVENYGIYNIVGGTISFLSIFTGSLSGAISRFITYGLGEGNHEKLKSIFSTSVSIQLGISAIIFIVAEIGGLWMLNSNLNIPDERINAAFWVLQFSIFTFITDLISVPYNACIIAHEEMKVFAYIGILEVILKLLFVFTLYLTATYLDRLITYAFLLFLVSIILRIIYGIYCKKKFQECNFQFRIDKSLLKEMMGYSGWSFFGNAAYIFNTQGVNVLINIFFGVTLNAARGIVTQVEGAVMKFVENFTTAITPQITKSYAVGNKEYMFTLICRGTKFSYFLLLLFLIPIELEANTILKIWLGVVPEYSALFLRLSLIGTVMVLLGTMGLKAIFATGKIRNYQLTVTIVGCLVFPSTWILYKLGYPVYVSYIVYIFIYGLLNVIRLFYMRKLLGFPSTMYLRQVLSPIVVVTVVAVIVPEILYIYMDQSFIRLITITIISLLTTSASIYLLGLNSGEKNMIHSKIYNIIAHFSH